MEAKNKNFTGLKKTIKFYEKNKSQPLVSIIMNCYNGKIFISINSILSRPSKLGISF